MSTVGRYELGDVIGVGSFATVHRAHDPLLEGDVVIKVLAENHSLNPEVRERFIAEGRCLRRVRSPHVVTVHDLGETTRQQPYLVLEHADRGTLGERVAEHRRNGRVLGRGDLLDLCRQLAAALGALHEARLVHRDLSPANVLITSVGSEGGAAGGTPRGSLLAADERLVLADLGLCKDLALNSGLTVTAGTSGFRPPEMEGGPAVVDQRADLWALSALVRWVADGGDFPSALDRVLDQGMAADPQARPEDGAAWLRGVEEALAESAGSGGTPTSAPATAAGALPHGPGTSEPRARGGRPLLLAGAGAVVALGVGGVFGWSVRGDGAPGPNSVDGSVSIRGPETISVGDPVDFTVDREGVESWVWTLPDGRYVVDEDEVTLSPASSGEATLRVQAQDSAGQPLADDHVVSVRAEG
ncbi:serine/threonine-protein kinase [Kytococcus sp. Marseille-QA3725]